MPDLREQLQQLLRGCVCLMGLGNVNYGDDGFGVRLAEELKAEARSEAPGRGSSDSGLQRRVIIAGTTPERFITWVADEGFDHVIFLDAVEFGGAPGSVVLLSSDAMASRFPQVSTHKLSLGLLARQVEANGRTKAWLLGVQPESFKSGRSLSPKVSATLELLSELLRACLGRQASSPWQGGGRNSSLAASAATRTMEVMA
jgi:hydrogenase maturation protease